MLGYLKYILPHWKISLCISSCNYSVEFLFYKDCILFQDYKQKDFLNNVNKTKVWHLKIEKKGNTATDRNTQREDNMNNRGENVMWREGRDWSDASTN